MFIIFGIGDSPVPHSIAEQWNGQRKKGYVTFDCVHHSLEEVMKKFGKEVHEEDHKPGELDAAKKLCDPKGTGKVEFEGFKALVLASIKHHKEHPDH